jgi:CheY-like chemotaxis protein
MYTGPVSLRLFFGVKIDATGLRNYSLFRAGDLSVRRTGTGGRSVNIKKWFQKKDAADACSGTALVVDDDPQVCELVAEVLRREGWQVMTVRDGEAALVAVRSAVPDIIFMDLDLPGMTGPEMLRSLREQGIHAPVVLVTGFPESALMEQTLEFMPAKIISKPVPVEAICRAASELVHRGAKRTD